MLRNIAHSTASENTASPAVPTLALESICLKYCKEFVGLPGFIGLFPLDMQKKNHNFSHQTGEKEPKENECQNINVPALYPDLSLTYASEFPTDFLHTFLDAQTAMQRTHMLQSSKKEFRRSTA